MQRRAGFASSQILPRTSQGMSRISVQLLYREGPIDCTFELNDKPMSTLKCGASSFQAFSGYGSAANRRARACSPGVGPIPPGSYFIIDRQSGGLLGPLRDLLNKHDGWFALYADDGKVDDETFCNGIKRGNFRLHPRGTLGISEGCITLDNPNDFMLLPQLLKASPQSTIPGKTFKAYGKVIVR